MSIILMFMGVVLTRSVVWEDYRNGDADIYGAVVSPSGSVLDTFIVSSKPGDQVTPSLAHGSGNQILIVYSGWTDLTMVLQ